ncbi:MAG TPA: DUF4127 family protein [Symbiobacteriaceae bacterium]|nr:DUF4127 family protein [Symbiobacteriaceae bacterium]
MDAIRIALIPLDERPCNLMWPADLAAVAGIEVVTPPRECLGHFRTAANVQGLSDWLESIAGSTAGCVVALNTLGYGGLIASRITDDPPEAVLDRLHLFRRLRAAYPNWPVFAFNVLMRVSHSNSAAEEPEYWERYGLMISQFSRLQHKVALGKADDEESAEERRLRAAIPAAILGDYLGRRRRNQAVALTTVDWLSEGVFDALYLTQDDTYPFGFAAQEQAELRLRIANRGVAGRALIYPGADEVGMVQMSLAARRILKAPAPAFFARYGSTGGPLLIPKYEDRPLHELVKAHVAAAGGCLADTPADADVVLCLNTPGTAQGDLYAPGCGPMDEPRVDDCNRNPLELARAAAAHAEKGRLVAVADVAYANGGDNLFMSLLHQELPPHRLAAYAAWNTAGNTIGTAVSHAAMLSIARRVHGDLLSRDQAAAHLSFLFRRLVDDWAYECCIRAEVGEQLGYGDGAESGELAQAVTARLNGFAREYFDQYWRAVVVDGYKVQGLKLGAVRLPWGRIFEIDWAADLELQQEGQP